MDIFNIREINGTKPINEWLENGIQDFAKREYGINITVKVLEATKDELDSITIKKEA